MNTQKGQFRGVALWRLVQLFKVVAVIYLSICVLGDTRSFVLSACVLMVGLMMISMERISEIRSRRLDVVSQRVDVLSARIDRLNNPDVPPSP